MEINRLSQEELSYEMEARGLPVGSVDNMRKSLRASRLLERRGSVDLFQDYPFSFEEDRDAVEQKLKEVESLMSELAKGAKPSTGAKAMAKLEWCLARIGRAKPSNDAELTQQSSLKSRLMLCLADLQEAVGEEDEPERMVTENEIRRYDRQRHQARWPKSGRAGRLNRSGA